MVKDDVPVTSKRNEHHPVEGCLADNETEPAILDHFEMRLVCIMVHPIGCSSVAV
jgi:hypothetical protein